MLKRPDTYLLKTFGGLHLVGSDGSPVELSRRRLALLVLLASAGDRGVARERLVAYLWPDSPTDAGRHSLEQMLSALRARFGTAVFVGTDPVRLDSRIITSELALLDPRPGEGADGDGLPEGAFLDGFYLEGLKEFEEWVERERARVHDLWLETQARLARRAESEGDRTGALRYWRRFVHLDPLRAEGALGLMRALVASGDRAAAVRHADLHQRLLKAELDLPPDSLVGALRAELLDSTERPPSELSPAFTVPLDDSVREQELESPSRMAPSRRLGHPPLPIVAAISLTLVALFGLSMRERIGGERVTAPDPTVIAVFPFRVDRQDTSLVRLGRAVEELLIDRFPGDPGPAALHPEASRRAWRETAHLGAERQRVLDAASRAGAGLGLTGGVLVTPAGVQVSTRLWSTTAGRVVAEGVVVGETDSLRQLVDGLAVRLMALAAGVKENQLPGLDGIRLPAIREFVDAIAHYRGGEWEAAADGFDRAVALDTAFALAVLYQELARHGFGAGGPDALPGVRGEVIVSYFDRLGGADQAIARAVLPRVFGQARTRADAIRYALRAVDRAPDRPEAWSALGTSYLRSPVGPDAARRAHAAFNRARYVDPAFRGGIRREITAALLAGDTSAAYRLSAADTSPEDNGVNLAVRLHREPGALTWLLRELGSGRLGRGLAGYTAENLVIHHLSPDAVLPLMDLRVRLEPGGGFGQRYQQGRRAILLQILGRPSIADSLFADRPPIFIADWSIFKVLYLGGDSGEVEVSAARLRSSVVKGQGSEPTWNWLRRACLLAQWDIARGRASKSAAYVPRMMAIAADTADPLASLKAAQCTAEIDAAAGTERKSRAEALARLDSLLQLGPDNREALHAHIRTVARLHESEGNLESALATIRLRCSVIYAACAGESERLREEGRLALLVGDTAGAVNAYRSYARLRRQAEPPVRSELDWVRTELVRLTRSGRQ